MKSSAVKKCKHSLKSSSKKPTLSSEKPELSKYKAITLIGAGLEATTRWHCVSMEESGWSFYELKYGSVSKEVLVHVGACEVGEREH